MSISSEEVPGMSVEELNARVKKLERELEKACQTAEDRAQELETNHCAVLQKLQLRPPKVCKNELMN